MKSKKLFFASILAAVLGLVVAGVPLLLFLLVRVGLWDYYGLDNGLLFEVPIIPDNKGNMHATFRYTVPEGWYEVSVVAVSSRKMTDGTKAPKPSIQYKRTGTALNGSAKQADKVVLFDGTDLTGVAFDGRPQGVLMPYPMTNVSHFQGKTVLMQWLDQFETTDDYETGEVTVDFAETEAARDSGEAWEWYVRIEYFLDAV